MLPVLALAFVARAAIALSGDFVLHPDEIMQYLEPAHRLVFGNGVTYWEYFYGARSWLMPGLVAGVLKLFDIVGLGQPFWYIGGVKLVFCAISLLIPAGMYFFARWHFGEASARVALLMGAFWYELVGFAHKPMTEFVATALLMSLLALCVRSAPDKLRVVLTAAVLAVLAVAIRVQYAPSVLLVLGLFFLRTGKKMELALAAATVSIAVGVFDAITWDSGLFHSYLAYIRLNLALGDLLTGASPGMGVPLLAPDSQYGAGGPMRLSGLARPPALRFAAAAYHSGAAYPFAAIAQDVSFHLRHHSALAADGLRYSGTVMGEQATSIVGASTPRVGGSISSDFLSRHPERAAAPSQSVSVPYRGDRQRRLPAQSGPNFCCLPLSCQRAWGHRPVAG